jgi:two-component system nitrogen regulation sensor histidine kinase GlnL
MIEDEALWTSLPVPALLLDADDKILQSNPAAESFLNLSENFLPSRWWAKSSGKRF